ncbi:UNVERIFIED_CONTAM: hypothetical protein DES50_10514 [Williamsia faeni]
MTPGSDRPPREPGATVGVDLDHTWTDLEEIEDEVRSASDRRSLTFHRSRLGKIRVTFAMRQWDWSTPGRKAEEFARRLADAGLPVAGGFISRTDFWQVQAAVDSRYQSGSSRPDPEFPDRFEMIAGLANGLNTVTVIELLDSPGCISESDWDAMQNDLRHHRPNSFGQSALGRGQIVLYDQDHAPEEALTSAGASAKGVSIIVSTWPIASVRVCRTWDWFEELAHNPDGSARAMIAETLETITGRRADYF